MQRVSGMRALCRVPGCALHAACRRPKWHATGERCCVANNSARKRGSRACFKTDARRGGRGGTGSKEGRQGHGDRGHTDRQREGKTCVAVEPLFLDVFDENEHVLILILLYSLLYPRASELGEGGVHGGVKSERRLQEGRRGGTRGRRLEW